MLHIHMSWVVLWYACCWPHMKHTVSGGGTAHEGGETTAGAGSHLCGCQAWHSTPFKSNQMKSNQIHYHWIASIESKIEPNWINQIKNPNNWIKLNWICYNQIESNQPSLLQSNQIRYNHIKPNLLQSKANQVDSNRIKSNWSIQIELNQVKSFPSPLVQHRDIRYIRSEHREGQVPFRGHGQRCGPGPTRAGVGIGPALAGKSNSAGFRHLELKAARTPFYYNIMELVPNYPVPLMNTNL